LSLDEQRAVQQLLLRLRQAAVHPQIGVGGLKAAAGGLRGGSALGTGGGLAAAGGGGLRGAGGWLR
jgi:hypothetical protein